MGTGSGMNDLGVTDGVTPAVIAALGFDVEIGCLREMIADWVAGCDEEMRAILAQMLPREQVQQFFSQLDDAKREIYCTPQNLRFGAHILVAGATCRQMHRHTSVAWRSCSKRPSSSLA